MNCRQRLLWASLVVVCLLGKAFPGGPLVIGGPAVGGRPAFGIDGEPFKWQAAGMPISYRLDPGPMATNPSGSVVVNNAAGAQRVGAMTGNWEAVSTAAISYSNVGPLLPAGSYTGGDLATVGQFNDVIGSCRSGAQSPVIFDANAQILVGLGLPPEVIGFATLCRLDTSAGRIFNAAVIMNGRFQDGVNNPNSSAPNFELSATEFNEAITHEIGHFSGLDHSQINIDVLVQGNFPCDVDRVAGMPLMFPLLACQARTDAGLSVLSADDVAAISRLYPTSSFTSRYGTISGIVFFADGVSQAQGANVIARLLDDPRTPEDESRRVAVSAVSGYLFTGNPGQDVTASLPSANTNGDASGSRKKELRGYYEISVPPGTYTVEVESLDFSFASGSSVGPLNPPVPLPGPAEFWNEDESAFDFPLQRNTVTVHAGDNIPDMNIILNTPFQRFDQQEDSGALHDTPLMSPATQAEEVLG